MARIKIYIFIMVIPILLLTGCWDKVEIDERAFITAVGFDKYEGGNNKRAEEQDKEMEGKSIDRYVRTITYPNVAVIAGKEQGKASYIYSTTSISWADAKQQTALRNNKNYFFAQVKAAVFGEKLVRDEQLFREILDSFQRDVSLNRKLYFLITPDKAQDILMTDTGKNMDVGLFIEELMDKELKSPRRARGDLGTIVIDLNESNAAMVPRIVKPKNELKISGSVILKDNKMAGMLGELETRDALILKGQAETTDYTIKVEDKFIVISQTSLKSKMKAFEDKEGKINVHFTIMAEGDITQHYFDTSEKVFDEKYINKVNKKVNELISKELEDLFKKVQKDFGADIFKVGENLRKFQPDTWDKVKDRWDEVYPNVKVKVDFQMNIRRVGIAR